MPDGYDAPENRDRRYPVLYLADGSVRLRVCAARPGDGELDGDVAYSAGSGVPAGFLPRRAASPAIQRATT